MVPYAKLKAMLLDEIRRQNKSFGLIIADISGGQTNTTTYDFQAFKGMPRIVYKVDAKTGKETLVRGVEFVGTPIGSLNRIQAASDTEGVFNGFCGAESGFVPVSTVAPALLISEIELQRTRRAMERPPILPAPFQPAPAPAAPPPSKPGEPKPVPGTCPASPPRGSRPRSAPRRARPRARRAKPRPGRQVGTMARRARGLHRRGAAHADRALWRRAGRGAPRRSGGARSSPRWSTAAAIDPGSIDDVILGCANQAGEDNRNVARMAALLAGLPVSVPGATVNRLCGSGLEAVSAGARAIANGEAELVVVGGVESMSRAPLVLPKAREAFPRGDLTAHDTTLGWRFVNPRMTALHGTDPLGETAEKVAERHGVSRAAQDAFALESQRRWAAAHAAGLFRARAGPGRGPGAQGAAHPGRGRRTPAPRDHGAGAGQAAPGVPRPGQRRHGHRGQRFGHQRRRRRVVAGVGRSADPLCRAAAR